MPSNEMWVVIGVLIISTVYYWLLFRWAEALPAVLVALCRIFYPFVVTYLAYHTMLFLHNQIPYQGGGADFYGFLLLPALVMAFLAALTGLLFGFFATRK